jgi:hypothetical protein
MNIKIKAALIAFSIILVALVSGILAIIYPQIIWVVIKVAFSIMLPTMIFYGLYLSILDRLKDKEEQKKKRANKLSDPDPSRINSTAPVHLVQFESYDSIHNKK